MSTFLATSQNPEVTFTSVGNYTITETVTTECGSDSFSSDLEVIGDPSVSFPVESQTYCSSSTFWIYRNKIIYDYMAIEDIKGKIKL